MADTTLETVMRTGNALPHSAVSSIIRDCALELDACGSKKRSPTPADILVSTPITGPEATAKLKELTSERVIEERAYGMRNPEFAAYLSPEEILGAEKDSRSDQFALAVIAYELLCGVRPFEGQNLSLLFYDICAKPPVPASEVNPRVPVAAARVLDKALAKFPSDRYATNTEFADALARAFEQPGNPGRERDVATVAAPAAALATAAGATLGSGAETPQTKVQNGTEPVQTAVPPSPVQYELPPARRRPRWDEEDLRKPAAERVREAHSPEKGWSRKWLAALALFVAGLVLLFARWYSTPRVPVQVANPNMGPAAPPPSEEPETDEGQGVDNAPAKQGAPASKTAGLQQRQAAPKQGTPKQTTAVPRSTLNRPAASIPAARPEIRRQSAAIQNTRSVRGGAAASPQPEKAYGSGSIDFITTPPGAHLTIDRSIVCTTPCTLTLPAGRHVLSATLSGYGSAERIFHIPEDNNVMIPMTQRTGVVLVNSVPAGATIMLDGHEVGRAPLSLRVGAGQHRLDFFSGSQARQQIITVEPDTIQGVTLDLRQ